MSARVLVVDDIAVNLRLLEAKLMAEYFQVLTARNGPEAIEVIAREKPDLVLLDVMMPGMDGFEVCRQLRSAPETALLPIVMVTALTEQQDRVRGLEAGADDFLSKPIQDEALFSRVRSLLRLKMVLDELKLREETSRELGIESTTFVRSDAELFRDLRIAVVMVDASDATQLCATLPPEMVTHIISADGDGTLVTRIADVKPELIVIDMRLGENDALRLSAELRSREATRFSAILLLADESDRSRLTKALELGVSDYLMKPIDPSELIARVRTQARYHWYRERLRGAYSESVNQAHTDGLTGLFNRRYVMRHIDHLRASRHADAGPIAAMMVDIDHFKAVNDTHGHDIGDLVLKEIAERLKGNLRPGDVVARLGGEEFLVVLPAADRALALSVAERLRHLVADRPIALPGSGQSINVTVSVGVTLDQGQGGSLDDLLKQADEALYRGKREGRNRVIFSDAVSAAA